MSTINDTLRAQLKAYLGAHVSYKRGIMKAMLEPFQHHHLTANLDEWEVIEYSDVVTLIEAALSAGSLAGVESEKMVAAIIKAQDDPSWGM